MKNIFQLLHLKENFRGLPDLCLIILLLSGCKKTALEPQIAGTVINSSAQAATATATATEIHTNTVIFDGGGSTGYHSFRIPSIVKTTNGTLIALAEGRMANNKDYGNINLIYKRSTDNGATWSALGEVVGVGPGTWGNPTAVVDATNGRVWVFMSWNAGDHNQFGTDGFQKIDAWGDRKVYVSYSDNHGVSWSAPQDLTNTLLPASYKWDAMGPGTGIQKKQVSHQNRLIIPAIGRNIYSGNGGVTWQYQLISSGTSEGTIVEKLNGTLMRNDRAVSSQWELSKRRRVSIGSIENGFPTWTSDNTLLDPACQGSILRYNTDSPNRILFLNSASTDTRGKMRVRISYDEGQTWPISRRIYDWLTEQQAVDQGKGGYSSMVKTNDFHVGALIEINEAVGDPNSHRSIEFHKFNLAWILNGNIEP